MKIGLCVIDMPASLGGGYVFRESLAQAALVNPAVTRSISYGRGRGSRAMRKVLAGRSAGQWARMVCIGSRSRRGEERAAPNRRNSEAGSPLDVAPPGYRS